MSALTGRKILHLLGYTVTKTEVNRIHNVVPGTAAANAVVVTDGNTNVTGLTLTNPTITNSVTSRTYTPGGASVVAVGGQSILLNSATGTLVTLPAATGSGKTIRVVVTVVPTSGAHVIKVANSSDFMVGQVQTDNVNTVTGYQAANSGTVATNSDTVSLNGTTTGASAIGNVVSFEDISANNWVVTGETTSTGTTATPFSATV